MAADLSIVIVNYNVKYFLEQCLYSVRKASQNISSEIFVVDNNSVDGSCAMIREKFPEVHLIENEENLGFSKANNQAIRLSAGRYILLLNPDTVIEEDTLTRCLNHMEKNPNAGALGVRMIDGKGNFLPESKRSFPTPRIAFYKVFGFSRLFPKSRLFSRYHLGYLDENKMNDVEVLPGAFMMLRKTTIDKVGLLDEDFFMYGEDIDISYRLMKAGYRNIYFPETTIIHYKGESTRKGSMNYVITFYRAMIIFARKHFSRKMAKSYTFLINIAIYFRAFLAIARRFIKNLFIPLLEAAIIYLGFYIIKPVWENYKFPGGRGYPDEYMLFVVPVYIFTWMLSLFFSGAYDRPFKLGSVIKGIIAGTVIILIVYALLPESLRYSRALLLIGGAWSLLSGIVLRLLAHISGIPGFELSNLRKKRIIIVGSLMEGERVESMLKKTEVRADVVGFVSTMHDSSGKFLGQTGQLTEIIKINRIDEIIFCAADISSQDIISTMMNLTDIRVNYKIAPPESLSIIGSNSINTAGDLYLIDFSSITKSSNRRNKRLFDLVSSVILLIMFPIILFLVKKPWNGLLNVFRVFTGSFSWIGYYPLLKNGNPNLPRVKRSILTPLDGMKNQDIPESAIELLNAGYAKNYNIFTDARILFIGLREIGRPVSK
jgi:O-antigen biosynthesis protein